MHPKNKKLCVQYQVELDQVFVKNQTANSLQDPQIHEGRRRYGRFCRHHHKLPLSTYFALTRSLSIGLNWIWPLSAEDSIVIRSINSQQARNQSFSLLQLLLKINFRASLIIIIINYLYQALMAD